MTREALKGRLKPLVGLLVIALPILSHYALKGGWPPLDAALLVAVQTLILVFAFTTRVEPFRRKLLASGAAVVAGILAYHWGRAGLSLSAGVMHAAINFFLFAFFAATLVPGRESLIGVIARHIHGGAIPAELQAHARKVTMAWCVFFLGQIGISLLLYLTAPLSVWSFFITILNPILLLAMLVVEIVYRRWRFRHLPQSRIRHMVRLAAAWRAVANPAADTGGLS